MRGQSKAVITCSKRLDLATSISDIANGVYIKRPGSAWFKTAQEASTGRTARLCNDE